MSYSSPGLLTDESRWLSKLARFARMQIQSTQGGVSGTPMQYDLLSADTLTLPALSCRSINFSVILGLVSLSMDGGSTTVLYPAGSNVNMNTSLINMDFVFTVPGSHSDGLNRVIIQTISV